MGVFKGHFSKVLLEQTNPKELHLIDPWYFLTDNWYWAKGNKSTIDAVCNVLQTYKKEIENKTVFVHIRDGLELLKTFPDAYFDWVYVDTTHEYKQTVAELNLLCKKVKPQGIICGDDWRPNPNNIHHGVYKAVNEFLEKNKAYKLLHADEDSWFITKKE